MCSTAALHALNPLRYTVKHPHLCYVLLMIAFLFLVLFQIFFLTLAICLELYCYEMGKVKGCSSLNSIRSYLMLSNTVERWDFTTYSISCVQCFLLKVSMGIFSVVFFLSPLSIIANYFRALAACAVSDGDVESVANCCLLLFQQERTRSFDGFSMHSLENSLIDIMRAEQDSLKGTLFPH